MAKKKLRPSKLFVQILLGLFSIDASAALISWNAASGSWSVAGNWSPASVPTAADSAFIDNGNTATVGAGVIALPGSVFAIGNSTLSITNGGILQSPSVSVAKASGAGNNGSGTLIVSGSGVGGPSSLYVTNLGTNLGGVPSALQATVTIQNGGVVLASNIIVNEFSAGGTTFNLNSGGLLGTQQITTLSNTTPANFIFDGGILAPNLSSTNFINGFVAPTQTFTINAGGLTINTNAFGTPYDTTIQSTFPGFAGVGALTKSGTGKLTMAAANTYTGDTIISGGIFQLGNSGTTGSVAGNIVDDAALIFDRSNTLTYGGDISGTGSFTQAGGGTSILTGTNTYTGGTTISAGTLQLGNGGGTGSVVGDILDNASLVVNRTVFYIYDGVISGTGSLSKTGNAYLILTNSNTFTGPMTIDAVNGVALGNGGTTGMVATNVIHDNGDLDYYRSNADTYGGVIDGTGTLTIEGGSLTLTGDNTYTGSTIIQPGTTLQLGNGGTSGSIVGSATDFLGGILQFNHSNTLTYTGSMGSGGSGSLQQIGTGTTILTGTNTYTGGTTISAGTLQLGNGGATGSVVGNILDNAALVFNHNVAFGYAGVISGTGSVRQSGAQTLVFTGDNTYTGITTIDPGTFLQLGNNGATGSIVGDVTLGGGLIFNRSNSLTYAGNMSGAGDVKQVGSGATTLTGTNTYTGGTSIIAGAGPLQLGNGGATGSVVGNIVDNAALIVNRSNSYTYGDIISGTGTLTKLGAGTLTLNGTNTFTGDTTINSGNLLLGDVAHPGAAVGGNVLVNAGGQLSGFGTVGGSLTNSGGIVSPGNSIGTITVNGNYTQSAAGSYIVQVDQAGNSDLLNILGTASLNGTVGISAINNGFLVNFPYTILQTATLNGVTGTFSNTNIDGIFNQGFLQGQVLYFPEMVQFLVNYNATLFNNAAQTPNQKAVANYILETGGTPAVQALIASITTGDRFRSALDQISGATYANNDVMITRVGNWFSGEMADRFDAFPSCNCQVSLLPANRRGCDQKNEFWVAGHGAEENIKGGDVSGLNTDTGNFALGYEWAAGSTGKVGVGAGYSTFSSRAQTREMANTSGNLYQVGLYGRNQMGNWLLGAAFDAGVTSDLDTDRRIEGALAVVTTKGSSKAHLYSEQVRLGYDLTPNRPMRLSPFVGVIGQQLNRNSFAENTQTGFELNVDGSTYRSTRSQLGVMLELPTNSAFKPFASVDWEHEFSDVNSTFNANLVGLGGKFHIEGQAIGRNSALVKAGTVIACGKNWNVSALYQGWYGNSWQENGGTLQASVAFG